MHLTAIAVVNTNDVCDLGSSAIYQC